MAQAETDTTLIDERTSVFAIQAKDINRIHGIENGGCQKTLENLRFAIDFCILNAGDESEEVKGFIGTARKIIRTITSEKQFKKEAVHHLVRHIKFADGQQIKIIRNLFSIATGLNIPKEIDFESMERQARPAAFLGEAKRVYAVYKAQKAAEVAAKKQDWPLRDALERLGFLRRRKEKPAARSTPHPTFARPRSEPPPPTRPRRSNNIWDDPLTANRL